ncbi:serine O-acetyltransferase [Hydrogenophaga palleronii]|uniref:serine O-acetyltransferase n=1 Tax=Hydrogenophaga palleronii TaxID=65655 RepID=UPI000A00CDA5|nr:serine acetyltransferase [Hydrogenophaga palleronii]
MTFSTVPPHQLSAVEPDWQRERLGFCEWNSGKRLLRSIRDYQRLRQQTVLFYPLRVLVVLRHRFWSVVSGADIPLNCCLGGGLLLPHPNGVVIHPDAVVGPNCMIHHQVTLGTVASGGVPTLAGRVDVGAGAKLLGPIVIGPHASIGANAVVLTDVPPEHVAVGIPARCRPRRGNA